jgi:taurine dioxygenase
MAVSIEVRPFDAPLGAEVHGVDFSRSLDDTTRRALLACIARYHLLVLRGHGEPPSARAYRDFGLRFGPLRPSVADLSRFRDCEEINLVSNTVEPDGVTGTGGPGVIDWHADLTFEPPTTDFIVLDAIDHPLARAGALPRAAAERVAQHLHLRRRDPRPADRRRPRIARRARRARDIAGVRYEHEWRPGDCVLWSNWTVFHRREPFDPSERRRMRHLTVSEGGPQIDA